MTRFNASRYQILIILSLQWVRNVGVAYPWSVLAQGGLQTVVKRVATGLIGLNNLLSKLLLRMSDASTGYWQQISDVAR